MQTIIRKAKMGDISQVVTLLKGILEYHHKLDPIYLPGSKLPNDSSQRITKLIRKRKAILVVAEVDKKIVGYFVADTRKTRIFVHGEIGYISDSFVDAKYRRKEIGKLMFEWTKDWFLKRGIERVELTVDTKNVLGIKAWQKYGFKEYQKKMWVGLKK